MEGASRGSIVSVLCLVTIWITSSRAFLQKSSYTHVSTNLNKHLKENNGMQPLRQSSVQQTVEDEYQAILEMKNREIVKELTARKVGSNGLYEKEELARLLSQTRVEQGAITQAGSGTTVDPASAGSPTATVPLKVADAFVASAGGGSPNGYITMKIDVMNGPGTHTETLTLVIDTCASLSVVSPLALTRLKRAGIDISRLGSMPGFSTGGVSTSKIFQIANCNIAGLTGQSLPCVSQALPIEQYGFNADGILGTEAMQKWSKFCVDPGFGAGTSSPSRMSTKYRTPRLYVGTTLPSTDNGQNPLSTTVPPRKILFHNWAAGMSGCGGLIICGAAVNGMETPIPALVDLGSALTVMNQRAADLCGLRPLSPGSIWAAGIDDKKLTMDITRIKRLTLHSAKEAYGNARGYNYGPGGASAGSGGSGGGSGGGGGMLFGMGEEDKFDLLQQLNEANRFYIESNRNTEVFRAGNGECDVCIGDLPGLENIPALRGSAYIVIGLDLLSYMAMGVDFEAKELTFAQRA